MSTFTYEIRYHSDLGWWDGRYRVYLVGQHHTGMVGSALTKWGARKLVKGIIGRLGASQAYALVDSIPEPVLPAEDMSPR